MAANRILEPQWQSGKLLPALAELGHDITYLTTAQRWYAVARPFLCVGAYAVFASMGWWIPAILAVAAYTFVSYGSTSHDLVHGNLGLPRGVNRMLLSIIELLGLRSGHAYRAAHLRHHRRFPHDDDVEATAAHDTLCGALLAGPMHQLRVWWWAMRTSRRDRTWIVCEGIACIVLLVGAIAMVPVTPIPLVYVVFVVLGSWTFPLLTSYLPHLPNGVDALHQTRRFRGKVAGFIFQQHYYHLEHHLYPKVPYRHWPTLAARLDPYLDQAGITAIHFGF